ncbi:hypothetical protein Trydic_g7154 [Trypoxylus dichotomus]
MTAGLDTLSNSRIQNAGHIPRGSHIERNHFDGTGGHDYYSFSHTASHSKTSSGKKSIALTALTLLAFMFFLNILQNCLQDQMSTSQPTQVMVLSSRLKQPKEADERKDEQVQDSQPILEIEDADEEDEKTYLKIARRILEPKGQEITSK